jgi:hypothetical protein
MSEPRPTCTVRHAVSGACGKPAVYTWVSTITGETFGECAEHYQGVEFARPSDGHEVGDPVTIQRCGKTYPGRVVEVGKRGAVYAEFAYDNGAVRRVRV